MFGKAVAIYVLIKHFFWIDGLEDLGYFAVATLRNEQLWILGKTPAVPASFGEIRFTGYEIRILTSGASEVLFWREL